MLSGLCVINGNACSTIYIEVVVIINTDERQEMRVGKSTWARIEKPGLPVL